MVLDRGSVHLGDAFCGVLFVALEVEEFSGEGFELVGC